MNVWATLCLFLIVLSCSNGSEIADRQLDKERIIAIMKAQQDAWNRGDIPGFMKAYVAGDSLMFIGSKGLTYGHDNTLNNYLKTYPDKERMGHLTFEILKVDLLGDSAAFVVGRWELKRKTDAPGGYFSLLWKKTKTGWSIAADHTI
jgi:ketosteroid isomerase-like protein